MAESSTGASTSGGSAGTSGRPQAADDPLAEFGANEWLVDEMYERYQQDPKSVDKVWWDFFKQHAPGGNSQGANGSSNGSSSSANGSSEAKQASKPTKKATDKPTAKADTSKPAASSTKKSADKSSVKSAEKTPDGTSAKVKPSSTASPRADRAAAKPSSANKVPKDPEKPAQPEADDEPSLTVLRGAPARTVQNMDVSLTVPTATSVRSVPVKLLIDNRTVINNHLARARGGKVSFTHII